VILYPGSVMVSVFSQVLVKMDSPGSATDFQKVVQVYLRIFTSPCLAGHSYMFVASPVDLQSRKGGTHFAYPFFASVSFIMLIGKYYLNETCTHALDRAFIIVQYLMVANS